MSISFRIGAATDVGRVRTLNEDSYLATAGFAVVADGMGGHRGGEVASAIAVTTLRNQFVDPVLESLVQGVQQANADILAAGAEDPTLQGMGTTLCAIALLADGEDDEGRAPTERLGIVNVGDSRVYVYEDDALTQITQDHSLVEALVREGRLTADEAKVHPQRNIVTRALGMGENVEIDVFVPDPGRPARYLLSSDGLFDEIGVEDISRILATFDDPNAAAEALVAAANAAGGRDNITTVVVDVFDAPESADTDDDAASDGDADTEPVVQTSISADGQARKASVTFSDPTELAEPRWADSPADAPEPDGGKRRWWRRGS